MSYVARFRCSRVAGLCHHSKMRSRIHTVVLPSEVGDFADEVRLVFLELGRTLGLESPGECAPPIDVYETDETVEITVDLPGVDPGAVRVLIKAGTVLIIGEKPARRTQGESSFHLVERGFGRFARSVRLSRACDAANAHARMANGELRVSIPKMADRRGSRIQVAIESAAKPS
jgi:HSP20 family protein